MTRAWFRRRLDTDPRRWVLLLAALEGLCAFGVKLADRSDLLKPGPAIALACALAAVAPATGVLMMLAHGRVLWWTGRVLGGRARPLDLHAAFAWSELPFLVASAPLALALPLRLLEVQSERRSAAGRVALDVLDAASGGLVVVAGVGALAGAVLYVRFLGEAQGFGAGRAAANHLLALAAGVALLAGGLGVAVLALPGSIGLVRAPVGFAIAIAIGAAIEARVRASARGRAHRDTAPMAPGA